MIYVTHITLGESGQRDARDPGLIRPRIMEMMRNSVDPGGIGRVLFRLDRTSLLLQSREELDALALPRDYATHVVTRMVNLAFSEGDIYRFSLVANPTTVVDSTVKKQVVKALDDTMGQLDWLRRKAAASGFNIESATIEPVRSYHCTKTADRASANAIRVRYRGDLMVTDVVAFGTAILEGIGRNKLFGCGMLVLDGIHTPKPKPVSCPWIITNHAVTRYREISNPYLSDTAARSQLSVIVNEIAARCENGQITAKRLDTGALQYRFRKGTHIRLIVSAETEPARQVVTVLPACDRHYLEVI